MNLKRGGLGIVCVGLALTGCSIGGKSLDQSSVEEQIVEGLTADVGIAPDSVDCDGISDIDVEEGSTFTCVGTAPNGETFDVDVTLTDDDGGFSAVVPG